MRKTSRYAIGLVFLLVSQTNSFAATQSVQAPPLPPGSEKVVLHPGQNPNETARSVRGHQRPKKDKQRNDTLPSATGQAATDVKDAGKSSSVVKK